MYVLKYVDRAGASIDATKWTALKSDPSYYVIRQFRNKDWLIRAIWIGRVEFYANSSQQAKARDKPFILMSFHSGSKLPKSFRAATEAELVNMYEDYLVRRNLGVFVNMPDGRTEFLDTGNEIRLADLRKTMGIAENEVLPDHVGSW